MMHVLVSSDKKYLKITATMLFSIKMSNCEPVHVWFLHRGIANEEQVKFIKYIKEKCGYDTTFVEIDDTTVEALKAPIYIKHITVETYYRLLAQFLLPEDLDRILWLDSDLIVKGSIAEFYYQELNPYSLIACMNMGESKTGFDNRKRLGLPDDYVYFNAGVLLLNLDYLRKKTTPEKILRFCHENIDKIMLQDQDVLNMLYHKSAYVLTNQIYNCLSNSPESFVTNDICERAHIIHYAGIMKPWSFRWQDDYSRYYWDVRKQEELNTRDKITIAIGLLWRIINGNKILKVVMSPWFWVNARLDVK